jgi:hypothetical protein
MNLGQILHEVGELRSPNGDRLRSNIKNMVNRAQRSICERRSWTFMADRIRITLPASAAYVSLPETFKELRPFYPVTYSDATLTDVPVTMSDRAALESLAYTPGFSSSALGLLPIRYAFLEQNGPDGAWTFNVPAQYIPSSDVSFALSGFFYLPDLVANSDENGITRHGELADALINRTKAIAYRAENPEDPRAIACDGEYERLVRSASYSDEHKRLAGRPNRW